MYHVSWIASILLAHEANKDVGDPIFWIADILLAHEADKDVGDPKLFDKSS